MTASLVLALGLVAAGAADDEVLSDREQVQNLLRSLHGPVADFEFQYEGHFRRLMKPDYSSLPDKLRIASERAALRSDNSYYQGTMAFRQDWAAHLDLYDRPEDDEQPLRREITRVLRGKYSRRVLIPDQGGPVGGDRSEPGGLLMFRGPKNALWMCLYTHLMISLKMKETVQRYRFEGWQTVGDARCAILKFEPVGSSTGQPGLVDTFYVDLERGGHPLRFERDDAGQRAAEVVDIKLAQFETEDGQSVWFPVSGRLFSYGMGLTYAKTPAVEQTFEVLRGTVAFNQDLGDSRFTLDHNVSAKDKPDPKLLRKAAQRSRSESIASRLAKELRKAEAASPELTAETPSQRGWFARNVPLLILPLLGVGALLTAILIKHFKS
jgi:hypothetical protein